MRIRKHWIDILILGSALPHLLATDDSSSSLISGNNDTSTRVQKQHQHQNQKDTSNDHNNDDDDHNNYYYLTNITTSNPDPDDDSSSSSSQGNDGIIKSISRPQHDENNNGNKKESQYDDEETIISEPQYSSSSVDSINKISLSYTSSSVDTFDDDIKRDSDDEDENEETVILSATQTVHEDGFRLPALSKTATVVDNDDDNSNDDINKKSNRINSQAEALSSTAVVEVSSTVETHDDGSIVEGKKIRYDDKSISDNENDENENSDNDNSKFENYNENNDDVDDNDNDVTYEQILDVVEFVEDENLTGYGIDGTTSTTEAEVEDDEVVVVEEKGNLVGYRTVGITSTEESIADDDDNGGISNDIDTDDIEEVTDGSTSSSDQNESRNDSEVDSSFGKSHKEDTINNVYDESNNRSEKNYEETKQINDFDNINNNEGIPAETSLENSTKETSNVEVGNNNEALTDEGKDKSAIVHIDENDDNRKTLVTDVLEKLSKLSSGGEDVADADADADATDETKQIPGEEGNNKDPQDAIVDENDVEVESVDEVEDEKLEIDGGKANESVDENKDETSDQLVEKDGKNESEIEETNATLVDDDDEDLTDRVSVDYASKTAGALIIEKSSDFKGTSNLMIGDRDKYAIVPCSEERKYVVLSLSEDILVKVIKLANYERFSSTIKDFQVKGSHTLGNWVDLGTYRAESGNGEQIFTLDNPTWARYLKFKFLTHHGAEYYCTLSQIQVHGSNMVQGFHEQWESIEENNEEYAEQSEVATGEIKADIEEKTDEELILIEEDVDSRNTSNSSTVYNEAPDTSAGNLDVITEVDSNSNNADTIPSMHSKMNPLNHFRSPSTFSEILQGDKTADEKLFSDLYDMIPDTLSVLPSHSRNSVGRQIQEDGEMRTVHQISRLAFDSLYSFGSRLVSGDISLLATEDDDNSIASPKMNDFSEEYAQKRFGSGLSSMISLDLSNSIDHSSTANGSSPNQATDQNNSSPGEHTKVTTKIIEEIPGPVSEDESKTSKSPAKKEEPTPVKKVEDVAVAGTNDPLDLAILKLLKDIPSAECLVNLDFAEFKTKVSAARKSAGTSGSPQSVGMMEPIFKKLTDEIFALQTSLSVHDQFTKMSINCYQRVVLDLALKMDNLRRDQEERLSRLEEQIAETASMRMLKKLLLSVISTVTTWFISNGSYLFVTLKNTLVPMIFQFMLSMFSKDTYTKINNMYGSFLAHFNNLIEDYSIKSNGWSQSATYKEFFSVWSTYYEGGMTVVVTVFTLLLCRMIMFCTSMRRRSSSSQGKVRDSQIRNNTNGSSEVNTNRDCHESHASSTALSPKSQKKRARKNKKTSQIDITALKSSEETIPELQDEIQETDGVHNGVDERILTSSPSIVSLEG